MLRGALQGAGEQLLLRPAPLVSDCFRQEEVLKETAHRPWPLPEESWFMGQIWLDLLFAHWPLPPEALESAVPSQLPLDTYDGSAWLGVTPFCVRGLRLRGTAPVPSLSTFAELNVRTYVTVGGKPGIYFLSLDAASWAAVQAARRSYRLPYFRSRIATSASGDVFRFEATRVSGDGEPAAFAASYGPAGERLPQRDGSLERWLTERYCLYTLDERRQVLRGEIHHPPWPLRQAWAEIDANTMTAPYGIELPGEPLLHFSARQDVALWPIRLAGCDLPFTI
jgi:uncharacterized protein YqjF (DUF2071 family)